MATYMEANQARLALKMKLNVYYWYNTATIASSDGEYHVIVCVKKINDKIRKIIPQVYNGVFVKTESE